jgi:hypothetical protein
MKKLLLLLVSIFIFSSCDDGDITLESFNFTNQQIQKCTDPNKTFLYKVNDNELLLFNITAALYTYDPTETEFPYTKPYAITGSSPSVSYRLYSDTVPATFICNSIAPANPTVTNEWTATGGIIEVTTTERYDTDGISLLGYTHTFKLLNVNFSNPNNSFSFEEYLFGNYQTDL